MVKYDKGFTTHVTPDGDVVVASEHFAETVSEELVFPLIGLRSTKRMRKLVEQTKKRLTKREDKLAAIKEEFKW